MQSVKASTTAIASPAPLRSHPAAVVEPWSPSTSLCPLAAQPRQALSRRQGRARYRYHGCSHRSRPGATGAVSVLGVRLSRPTSTTRARLLDQSTADGEQVDTEPPTDGAPDPTLQQQCNHDRDHAHRDEVERLVILELVAQHVVQDGADHRSLDGADAA